MSTFKVTCSVEADLKISVEAKNGDGARDVADRLLSGEIVRGTLENGEPFEMVIHEGRREICEESTG